MQGGELAASNPAFAESAVEGWKNRFIHQSQHPYPDVFDPSVPYPMFKLSPLFEPGQLLDSYGREVKWEALRGKSVALYFADWNLPKCKSFLPMLCNAYRTFNESGDFQKVEIVYVPMDGDLANYEKHRARMPWLAVPWGDPLVAAFKHHFRVMPPTEIPKYGYGGRMGLPTLLIVRGDGSLLQQLDISEHGAEHLRKWDVTTNRF